MARRLRPPFWRRTPIQKKRDIGRLRPPTLNRGERFETKKDARRYSRDRSRQLLKAQGPLEAIATALESCRKRRQQPCDKPYCPVCARDYRRWFFSELAAIAKTERDAATIVTVHLEEIPGGSLQGCDLRSMNMRLRKRLERLGQEGMIVIGAIEAGYQHRRRCWVVHAHLVIFRVKPSALAEALRKWPGQEAAKPSVQQKLRHHIVQLSYLSKFVTYHRPRLNGQSYPLNDRECREWVQWVAQYSFADFLFLLGARRRADHIVFNTMEGH